MALPTKYNRASKCWYYRTEDMATCEALRFPEPVTGADIIFEMQLRTGAPVDLHAVETVELVEEYDISLSGESARARFESHGFVIN